MRLAVDTGGTFTDLVVQGDGGRLSVYKSPTTPDDPVRGVLDVLEIAAADRAESRSKFVAGADFFIYATTTALNALLTGSVSKTAFLTTAGHRDILVLREGGREHFNVREPFPTPYVPRSLTFEIPERIGADGEVVRPFDEEAAIAVVQSLRSTGIEAVAVCLLWSIVNPDHELLVGRLLEQYLPGVQYTLSHQLTPTLREYRRASATAIDASLKQTMSAHLNDLGHRLSCEGFAGRLLMVTSSGTLRDLESVAAAPIHAIKSGPAMAPVAGRRYAQRHAPESEAVVVVDTGGTSYDVSLVRRGRLPWTRETWIGPRYLGHMTGFPSIDVRSYGSGGGSIASVDRGGLLHVGPESAGSVPGPACYGRGGVLPTVTDAALALGYIDPTDFLGGAMPLVPDAAARALDEHVGGKLGLATVDSAAAIMRLVTEQMARAVEDTAVSQGVDVRSGIMVAGGGAAGLNCVAIARRLGCARLLIPNSAAVLSAAGALMSDLGAHFSETCRTTTAGFDYAAVAATLGGLQAQCDEFIRTAGSHAVSSEIEYSVEGHYPSEVYDLEVILDRSALEGPDDVATLRNAFHATHEEMFAVTDVEAQVELVTWHARVSCRLELPADGPSPGAPVEPGAPATRRAYFPGEGWIDVPVHRLEAMEDLRRLKGPLIVASPVTTVVVDPSASVSRLADGTLLIHTL